MLQPEHSNLIEVRYIDDEDYQVVKVKPPKPRIKLLTPHQSYQYKPLEIDYDDWWSWISMMNTKIDELCIRLKIGVQTSDY